MGGGRGKPPVKVSKKERIQNMGYFHATSYSFSVIFNKEIYALHKGFYQMILALKCISFRELHLLTLKGLFPLDPWVLFTHPQTIYPGIAPEENSTLLAGPQKSQAGYGVS